MIFQKCPVCMGDGLKKTMRFDRDYSVVSCPTCDGAGIVSSVTGLPPKEQDNEDIWAVRVEFVKDMKRTLGLSKGKSSDNRIDLPTHPESFPPDWERR